MLTDIPHIDSQTDHDEYNQLNGQWPLMVWIEVVNNDVNTGIIEFARYWIDAFLGDFIPFILVFAGNVVVVTKIVIASRQRAVQMQATTTSKDDKSKSTKVH